jgi:GNAT superfamily N-acetyltransferase
MSYVRYESPTPNARGTHPGIFALADGLARSGRLSASDHAWWRMNNDWFEAAYTDPATVDPTLFHRPVSGWFKDTATHLLERVPGYLDLLDRHGVRWTECRSPAPGPILYEDPVQIVVAAERLEAGVATDAAAVVRLRDAAAGWMLARGIEQWHPGEAHEARLAARADAGELFVVRDGREVVAAVVIASADPEIWGPRPDDAGYVHTLVIDRRRAGTGLGRRVLARAEARIAARGASFARLDCVAGLVPYYRAAGYTEFGHRTFDNSWTPVTLFQKELP